MDHFMISLQAARVNAEMDQPTAAQKMGVSVQTIVNWEKGRTEPSIQQARRLSELYGIPVDYIFFPSNQI